MEPILVILGPTAVGKSALGLRIARRSGGEIVNADALQVYRGFDVGTAKPTPEERAAVRHHLVDILDPEDRFSAGEFARRAREAIVDIQERDRLAIVVGGSGLYLRALIEGISPMPETRPGIRRWLDERPEEELPRLRRMLGVLDPASHRKIAEGDTQRTKRALEIVLTSGRPRGWWTSKRPFGKDPLPSLRVGLTLPRGILYDLVERRVAAMIESGWVAEVESLLTSGVEPDSPAFQAIGYREIARFVRGELDFERARKLIVRATRRYAKRQLTWFRREPDVHWISADRPDEAARRVEELLVARGIGRDDG